MLQTILGVELIPVDDPDDPRLEHYRTVRDRDLAGRGRRFIAEGEVVVRMLLDPASNFAAESLLLAETRAAALRPALERLGRDPRSAAIPVYVASQPVMDRIVGFHIHRGVLAVGCRGSETNAAELLSGLPPRALVLALAGIANHDNVGGAFRNAAAFGADAVLLDRASCDPLYRKAIRVSVGGVLRVPFGWSNSVDEMVEALTGNGFEVVALSPAGGVSIEDRCWGERAALLMGSEGRGLAPSLLSRVPSVRIEMAEGFDSLNVATASGVALHRVRSARTLPRGN